MRYFALLALAWQEVKAAQWLLPLRDLEPIKGHFKTLIGDIYFLRVRKKSKTTSECKHTLNKWEIWPQKPLLTTGKSFSHEEK